MARKSQAQRLEDAQATLELWVANGHEQEKPALFIAQMIQSMGRGRYPSAGQRRWLDTLSEEGEKAFPTTHNHERLSEIDEAINTVAMSRVDVLRDFRYKLKKGWALSEKQESFLASLLEQAADLRANGLPVLTEDEVRLVESLLLHGKTVGRGDYYGYQQGKVAFLREVGEFYNTHKTVTKSHLESLQKMFKGVFRALTEKKFPIGSFVPAAGRNGIVMSDAYVNANGAVVIDVMASGTLKPVPYKNVGKRLLKNEVELSPFWDSK